MVDYIDRNNHKREGVLLEEELQLVLEVLGPTLSGEQIKGVKNLIS